MTTDHGGWRIVLTNDIGSLIGGWPSGSQEEDVKGASGSLSVAQDATCGSQCQKRESGWCKNAMSICSSKYYVKYCVLQHGAARGEHGIFAGPSLV